MSKNTTYYITFAAVVTRLSADGNVFFNRRSQTLDQARQYENRKAKNTCSSIRQLEVKSQRLFSLDELIWEVLFTSNPSETDLQQEFDEIEFYRDQIIIYRSDSEVLVQKICRQDDQMSQTQSTARGKCGKPFDFQ